MRTITKDTHKVVSLTLFRGGSICMGKESKSKKRKWVRYLLYLSYQVLLLKREGHGIIYTTCNIIYLLPSLNYALVAPSSDLYPCIFSVLQGLLKKDQIGVTQVNSLVEWDSNNRPDCPKCLYQDNRPIHLSHSHS